MLLSPEVENSEKGGEKVEKYKELKGEIMRM